MNSVLLGARTIRSRPLPAVLTVLLLALGIATVVVVLLFQGELEDRLGRDARGIDLVVGAKGSGLQLVLSAVFHADVPTGNVRLPELRDIARHPMVAGVIPLSLGDAYRGFRVVGTTHDVSSVTTAARSREGVCGNADGGGGRLAYRPKDGSSGRGIVPRCARARRRFRAAAQRAPVPSGGRAAGDRDRSRQAHPRQQCIGVGGARGAWRSRGRAGRAPGRNRGRRGSCGSWGRREPRGPGRRWCGDGRDRHRQDGGRALGPPRGRRGDTALLVRTTRSPRHPPSDQRRNRASSPALETARLFLLVGTGLDVFRAFAGILVIASAQPVADAMHEHATTSHANPGSDPRPYPAFRPVQGAVLGAAGAMFMALGHAAGWSRPNGSNARAPCPSVRSGGRRKRGSSSPARC